MSTLAAALLRHQRAFFVTGVVSGFGISILTGRSAAELLTPQHGAWPPGPARARTPPSQGRAPVRYKRYNVSLAPCICIHFCAGASRLAPRAGDAAREGATGTAGAAAPLHYSFRLHHAPPFN
jgi:hypothetical protein